MGAASTSTSATSGLTRPGTLISSRFLPDRLREPCRPPLRKLPAAANDDVGETGAVEARGQQISPHRLEDEAIPENSGSNFSCLVTPWLLGWLLVPLTPS